MFLLKYLSSRFTCPHPTEPRCTPRGPKSKPKRQTRRKKEKKTPLDCLEALEVCMDVSKLQVRVDFCFSGYDGLDWTSISTTVSSSVNTSTGFLRFRSDESSEDGSGNSLLQPPPRRPRKICCSRQELSSSICVVISKQVRCKTVQQ
jgi:hypothetical protein